DGGRAGLGPSSGIGGIRRGAWAQPRDASMRVWSTRPVRLCRMIDVTAMPDASRPHATSTRVAATSATRRGTPRARNLAMPPILRQLPSYAAVLPTLRPVTERSSRFAQDVPHAPQRVQQPLLPGVDLAAQVGDVGLDDVHVAAEVVAPDVVEDLGLGQHRARVDDEVAQ